MSFLPPPPRQLSPQRGDGLESLGFVVEIEDVGLFGPGIRRACLGVGHDGGETGEFLDKSIVVTGGDDTFAVDIDDVITHHLAAADIAERGEKVT